MARITGDNSHDTLDGTEGDDEILGKAGNDKLGGIEGDDYLAGGPGKDKLKGGPGEDTFVFDEKLGSKNVDQIVDNDLSGDVFLLSARHFEGMGAGAVKAKFVVFGNKAKDKNDHIIISDRTDTFYYDPDGNGRKEKVAFVEVKDGIIPELQATDSMRWLLLDSSL